MLMIKMTSFVFAAPFSGTLKPETDGLHVLPYQVNPSLFKEENDPTRQSR